MQMAGAGPQARKLKFVVNQVSGKMTEHLAQGHPARKGMTEDALAGISGCKLL